MDIWTYRFTKTLSKRIAKPYKLPEEVKEIVEWAEGNGLVLQYVIAPQTMPYSTEEIEGSYAIDLFYDLGLERKQFLKLSIYKNQWSAWKTEWRLCLDEIKDNDMTIGNDFEELKTRINKYCS